MKERLCSRNYLEVAFDLTTHVKHIKFKAVFSGISSVDSV